MCSEHGRRSKHRPFLAETSFPLKPMLSSRHRWNTGFGRIHLPRVGAIGQLYAGTVLVSEMPKPPVPLLLIWVSKKHFSSSFALNQKALVHWQAGCLNMRLNLPSFLRFSSWNQKSRNFSIENLPYRRLIDLFPILPSLLSFHFQ